MPAPDFLRPLRGTEDIPTHRIRGMGLTLGSQMPARIVKPYVYRGLGYDLFPETEEEGPPKPRPDPKDQPETARVKARPRRRKPKPRPKPLDIQDTSTWGNWRRQPAPPPRVPKKPGGVQGYTRRSLPPTPRPRQLRPAAGWAPITGSELDSLLDEVE